MGRRPPRRAPSSAPSTDCLLHRDAPGRIVEVSLCESGSSTGPLTVTRERQPDVGRPAPSDARNDAYALHAPQLGQAWSAWEFAFGEMAPATRGCATPMA